VALRCLESLTSSSSEGRTPCRYVEEDRQSRTTRGSKECRVPPARESWRDPFPQVDWRAAGAG